MMAIMVPFYQNSASCQQAESTSTTLEENDITTIDGLVRNLKKVNHYIHCLLTDYLSLVFTKSVDSNFRMF